MSHVFIVLLDCLGGFWLSSLAFFRHTVSTFGILQAASAAKIFS